MRHWWFGLLCDYARYYGTMLLQAHTAERSIHVQGATVDGADLAGGDDRRVRNKSGNLEA